MLFKLKAGEKVKLSKRMIEAIDLLKKEEFYLWEFPEWSFWRAYGLPGSRIRTDTMKALERRGLVKIGLATGDPYCDYVAKLSN